jgi:hypothetical protein
LELTKFTNIISSTVAADKNICYDISKTILSTTTGFKLGPCSSKDDIFILKHVGIN